MKITIDKTKRPDELPQGKRILDYPGAYVDADGDILIVDRDGKCICLDGAMAKMFVHDPYEARIVSRFTGKITLDFSEDPP